MMDVEYFVEYIESQPQESHGVTRGVSHGNTAQATWPRSCKELHTLPFAWGFEMI